MTETQTQARNPELEAAEIERLAVQLHDTRLGCYIGDWQNENGYGRGCIADHEAQARVVIGASR